LGSCHQAFENRFEGGPQGDAFRRQGGVHTNGMFLYTAMEELRMLREFSVCDWHNHPKFNQSIVRHLFETCSALGLAPTSTLKPPPVLPYGSGQGGLSEGG
jgi:hypothetical protein